jgi:hypothetical protein
MANITNHLAPTTAAMRIAKRVNLIARDRITPIGDT